MDNPVEILRMIERIVAVLIGGLSIYLGYRLFFHLPYEKSHQGELELPGVKIVLSRVGPGIFFGVFGTLVMYYSLTNPVVNKKGNGEEFIGASVQSGQAVSNTMVTSTPQQRSKALTSIEMLNCVERLLGGMTEDTLVTKLSIAIRDAKRALLLSVWDQDDWGSVERLSITGPTDNAPLVVRTRFNTVYGDCPR
jgi:hypothetical protein